MNKEHNGSITIFLSSASVNLSSAGECSTEEHTPILSIYADDTVVYRFTSTNLDDQNLSPHLPSDLVQVDRLGKD